MAKQKSNVGSKLNKIVLDALNDYQAKRDGLLKDYLVKVKKIKKDSMKKIEIAVEKSEQNAADALIDEV
ncbi:MAG: hypothetical protein ACD_51C00061G0004 [uncultured bacterium]|nr:MAG: hypothetical protein ACD_51C00061G0004 [uncultured bacterium]OGJ47775.1 MAG: hypothetical protein A2244_03980 [Candidatus Peregrinibacteria bacterium RIFOXYA2_FULL_41_18]OGJ49084.1 MAG: hypothetical protein A2344_05890 [Candidatus Peregrinibacteria bacterium RIFOXYB12_FULL_41_12]OGJ52916.1 MAG: hypothetical protein A2336_04905 [Candidatus Peregrinibacteria bacterium RIFOXYB2_FULL_41_88]OGJ53543.1 MAG: hypothetical protein A2448_04480 [Candidatus Peregrinibacteria bacterium RIFOXYC2_FULL